MTAIFNALNAGHGAEEILKYLSKAMPGLQKSIRKATSSGYNAKQILGFLSKNFETEDRSGLSESQIHGVNRRADEERAKYGMKLAAVTGATALAAPMAASALQRAIPNSLGSLIPGLAQQTAQGAIPTQGQPGQKAPSSPNPSSISPQTPPINTNVTPTIPQSPIPLQPQINLQSLLTKFPNLQKTIEQFSSRVKNINELAPTLRKLYPDFVKEIEKESKVPFEDIITEYSNNAQKQPLEASNIEETVETPKIEKQSLVATPQDENIEKGSFVYTHLLGPVVVKEKRGAKAVVSDEGGKYHLVDVSSLEPEPQEVKESQISFDINQVPESLRSAPLNEVYVPGHKKHITVKFNSNVGQEKDKRYLYFRKDDGPIDQSIIDRLREGVQLPVTSGENFWGAWDADTQDSRGTVAFHELTRMAQREGEEDDPSKPYWFVEEEEVFTHGYRKEYEKRLKEKEKAFNEKRKKRKKKST